jgi:hypothetical protein
MKALIEQLVGKAELSPEQAAKVAEVVSGRQIIRAHQGLAGKLF